MIQVAPGAIAAYIAHIHVAHRNLFFVVLFVVCAGKLSIRHSCVHDVCLSIPCMAGAARRASRSRSPLSRPRHQKHLRTAVYCPDDYDLVRKKQGKVREPSPDGASSSDPGKSKGKGDRKSKQRDNAKNNGQGKGKGKHKANGNNEHKGGKDNGKEGKGTGKWSTPTAPHQPLGPPPHNEQSREEKRRAEQWALIGLDTKTENLEEQEEAQEEQEDQEEQEEQEEEQEEEHWQEEEGHWQEEEQEEEEACHASCTSTVICCFLVGKVRGDHRARHA